MSGGLNSSCRYSLPGSRSRRPKGISVCFYDITTLYFETTVEDEFRQKGFSKDHLNLSTIYSWGTEMGNSGEK